MDLKEVGSAVVHWIHLAHGNEISGFIKCRAFVD